MPFMPRGPAGAAPGGPPGGGAPVLPKSPIGGAGGPGASPMVSPGNNAGGKAAAAAKIKACMQTIQIAALSYEPGSKEFNGVMGALRSLNSVFGKPTDQDLVPAARRQIAEAPKPPLAGSPPAGLGGAPQPPMMPPPGAMTGGGGEAPEM
jgi:hypothetical protein